MADATIWKAEVLVNDVFHVEMPRDSRILSVGLQRGVPQMWYFVPDPKAEIEMRVFRVIGTGHPIPEAFDELEYIDTIQLHDGALVFHVFEWLGK